MNQDKMSDDEWIPADMVRSPNQRGKISLMSKIQKFGWQVLDKPGDPMLIAKEDLKVDPAYQRLFVESRAINMARAWSWIAFGSLTVARRPDGSLWVVEGQHRLGAAMRRSDIQALPCMVFDVLDIKAEASSFLRANTSRKAVGWIDKFRAMVAIGDETAVLVDTKIKDAGYSITKFGTGKSVSCVLLLYTLAKTDLAEFERGWQFIVDAHGGGPLHQRVIQGLYHLLKTTDGAIAQGIYRKRVIALGRPGLLNAVNRASAFYTRGGSRIWADGILQEVNHGLRKRLECAPTPANDETAQDLFRTQLAA